MIISLISIFSLILQNNSGNVRHHLKNGRTSGVSCLRAPFVFIWQFGSCTSLKYIDLYAETTIPV
jgi:hypothetical protein